MCISIWVTIRNSQLNHLFNLWFYTVHFPLTMFRDIFKFLLIPRNGFMNGNTEANSMVEIRRRHLNIMAEPRSSTNTAAQCDLNKTFYQFHNGRRK